MVTLSNPKAKIASWNGAADVVTKTISWYKRRFQTSNLFLGVPV